MSLPPRSRGRDRLPRRPPKPHHAPKPQHAKPAHKSARSRSVVIRDSRSIGMPMGTTATEGRGAGSTRRRLRRPRGDGLDDLRLALRPLPAAAAARRVEARLQGAREAHKDGSRRCPQSRAKMPQHTHTTQSSITSRMTRKAHAHSTSPVVASAVEPRAPRRAAGRRRRRASEKTAAAASRAARPGAAGARARRALPLAPRRGGYARPSRSSKRAPRFCHQGQSRCSSEAWSVT